MTKPCRTHDLRTTSGMADQVLDDLARLDDTQRRQVLAPWLHGTGRQELRHWLGSRPMVELRRLREMILARSDGRSP